MTLKKEELLFFIPYALYLFCLIFADSVWFELFYVNLIIKFLKLFVILPILLVGIIKRIHLSKNSFLTILVVGGIISLNFFLSSDTTYLFIILFVIDAKNISIEKILKFSLFLQISCVVFILACSLIGLIENRIYIQSFGTRIRYSLGFQYSAIVSNYSLHITLLYLYIRKNRVILPEIFIIAGLNYWIFLQTNTRMAFVFSLIALIISYLLKFKKINLKKPLYKMIMIYSVPGFALAIIIATLVYDSTNPFQAVINSAVNQRLYLGHNAVESYGIQILARNILFNGSTQLRQNPDLVYNYVDSSYVSILIKQGVIGMLILCAMYIFIGKKIVKTNNIYMGFAIFLIAVHSILEPQLMSLQYNPFILVIFSELYLQITMVRSNQRNEVFFHG